MRFLNPLYMLLHFLVVYVHCFFVAFSELVENFKVLLRDRTFHSWLSSNTTTTAKQETKRNETLILQTIGCELRRLQKFPTHVACLFVEQEVNVDKIINIIEWCTIMGVSCISLYDHYSSITSCQDKIKTRLKNLSATFSNGLKSKSFSVHTGFVSRHLINPDCINVFLMNCNDGKPLFAKVAKQVVDQFSASQIDQGLLENTMNQLYPRDPEIMLQFGNLLSNTTLGYSPWHLRLTEIIRVPYHIKLRAEHIVSAFSDYSSCQQRYGK